MSTRKRKKETSVVAIRYSPRRRTIAPQTEESTTPVPPLRVDHKTKVNSREKKDGEGDADAMACFILRLQLGIDNLSPMLFAVDGLLLIIVSYWVGVPSMRSPLPLTPRTAAMNDSSASIVKQFPKVFEEWPSTVSWIPDRASESGNLAFDNAMDHVTGSGGVAILVPSGTCPCYVSYRKACVKNCVSGALKSTSIDTDAVIADPVAARDLWKRFLQPGQIGWFGFGSFRDYAGAFVVVWASKQCPGLAAVIHPVFLPGSDDEQYHFGADRLGLNFTAAKDSSKHPLSITDEKRAEIDAIECMCYSMCRGDGDGVERPCPRAATRLREEYLVDPRIRDPPVDGQYSVRFIYVPHVPYSVALPPASLHLPESISTHVIHALARTGDRLETDYLTIHTDADAPRLPLWEDAPMEHIAQPYLVTAHQAAWLELVGACLKLS